MSKILESAVRNVDIEDIIHENEETTWKEFQKHHPEIRVLYNKALTKVVDVDFSKKVISPYIHYNSNGEVEYVHFYFNGHSYYYPPEYKHY